MFRYLDIFGLFFTWIKEDYMDFDLLDFGQYTDLLNIYKGLKIIQEDPLLSPNTIKGKGRSNWVIAP